MASVAPDVDGLGLIFGRDTYVRYHHVVAHNFLFISAVTLVSAAWIGFSPWGLGRVLASGLVHLLGDYWGSGQGWPLYLWEPFNDGFVLNPHAWDFNGPESKAIFFACVIASLFIARELHRTPFEAVVPPMDRALSDLAAWVPSRRCACGGAGIWLCQVCGLPLCRSHARSLGRFGLQCEACLSGSPGATLLESDGTNRRN